MRRCTGEDLESRLQYFHRAAEVAKSAACLRASCGSVIVKVGKIIGEGSNGPAGGSGADKMCQYSWDLEKKPKYDKTCCVHAEWRAIINACKDYGEEIEGATLYFMRIDEKGNFTDAPAPFCTVCSRLALEARVAEFVLWHDGGAEIYTTPEYNQLSYDFYNSD